MGAGVTLEHLIIRDPIKTFLLLKDLAVLTLRAEVIPKPGT